MAIGEVMMCPLLDTVCAAEGGRTVRMQRSGSGSGSLQRKITSQIFEKENGLQMMLRIAFSDGQLVSLVVALDDCQEELEQEHLSSRG